MTPGFQMLQLVRDVRSYFEDVGRMLETAEQFLRAPGWKSPSSQAVAYVGQIIDAPSRWCPSEAFRFLRNESVPEILVVLSAILAEPDQDPIRLELNEPLVIASWFRFKKVPKLDVNSHWLARWRLYQPQPVGAGFLRADDAANDPKDVDNYGLRFQSANSLAVPLLSIRTPDELRRLVTDPLLHDMVQFAGVAEFTGRQAE